VRPFSMPTTAELQVDEMTVERSLHSKYVSSPQRLSMELKDLLGPGQYRVEVVFLVCPKLFSIANLTRRCVTIYIASEHPGTLIW
jgi:hypothetical protein